MAAASRDRLAVPISPLAAPVFVGVGDVVPVVGEVPVLLGAGVGLLLVLPLGVSAGPTRAERLSSETKATAMVAFVQAAGLVPAPATKLTAAHCRGGDVRSRNLAE